MKTLLERFLRYVQIDTQADEKALTYPSSPGQLVLGRMLCDELLALGYVDARVTEFGIVHATIPANVPDVPVVALNSTLTHPPSSADAT